MRLIAFLLLLVVTAGADKGEQTRLMKERIAAEKDGASVTPPPSGRSPEEVIDAYLALPYPDKDRQGEARTARLAALNELKAIPDLAPDAISKALPRIEDPRRRSELVEVLRWIRTPAAAGVCVKSLDDPDATVRHSAVLALRLMARKTDRIGPQRHVRADGVTPAVPDLVPHLIRAADDEDERVRMSAIHALADTRDPAAIEKLRQKVQDPSERVRLPAACLLTEFHDASGLQVMREALENLRKQKPDDDVLYYWHAEMLLASFERLTGKSFGQIPMNPHMLSDSRQFAPIQKQFAQLIEDWSAWWAWEPKPHAPELQEEKP